MIWEFDMMVFVLVPAATAMMDFKTAKSSTESGNDKPFTAKLGLLNNSNRASDTCG